jgi:hypothetical protein
MTESHADFLTAWTKFRDEKWDGCSHLDCLPSCRLTVGNYHCARLEQAFALSRPSSSSTGTEAAVLHDGKGAT